ncbi:ankyrin repeat domain-containing protein [Pseudoalteromonas sp. SWXJZ94C]|uniref:ankyrin repeat domain-containing protein n=1 Tax=unclassified Pseudoalteromonas TaxID=194690 RepID=UPI00040E788A|nr:MULTISPECIES: ankyrin repeat domain-containing protein [unclassified Pseudoalteromonas]MBH0058343.1 ankyrin repeat domain-containing protein [Pseudoalteromonas sp. SWXJZ94C]
MENVLIWPKEYPLLIKGLVEQNGAFILDALEAWPACRSTDEDDGVCTTVLPPIYYLAWLTPLEPFEECFFQHISEYDEDAQAYISAVKNHFYDNEYTPESLVLMLCQRLEQYASVAAQNAIATPQSLLSLFFSKRYFTLIEHALNNGSKLSAVDTLALWKELDFRDRLSTFIPESVADLEKLSELASEKVATGKDYFTLLTQVSPDVDSVVLLEKALLTHLRKKTAKQTMAMRFIEQGATGTLADENNKTAFMWAAERGFVSVVETLLTKQDKKVSDNLGNTALHYAVLSKNESLMVLLIKAGYDFRTRNKEGLSCYRLAVSIKATNLVKCLERDFGIKELSPDGQFARIKKVHALHAIVTLLFPLQLFFFFDDTLTVKSELTLGLTMLTVICFFFAMSLKRCALYPHIKHPWGLFVLRIFSLISLVAQLGLASIVTLAALSDLV